ncbi:MAG: CYTH domain-containing protein [Ectothiorhodospiraceae bacterium]
MGTEVERKFLVTDPSWRESADDGVRYRQGYLIGASACSVRVRTAGNRAWLNIKSATVGVQRQEFEYAIPQDEAEVMLETLCERPLVEKVRYHVPVGGHVWEVDCFEGDNAGLVVAEVELTYPDEAFDMPEWAGAEVSHLPRYYNVCLVRHPYSEWSDDERAGH